MTTLANPYTGSDDALYLRVWREDPVLYVRQRFNTEPDPSQIELLQSFPSQSPEHLRIATQSCAGTGKTTGLAWATLNFMECYGDRDNDPQGAAVSITRDNLHDYFVKELAKWIGRSPDLQRILDLNDDRLALRGRERTGFMSFRSFPKDADQETLGRTLSGLHGKYILQVLDEVGAMPSAVGRTAEQARDKDQVFFKVLASGNPVSTDGLLHEIATNLRHLWHIIVVTGDPDDPQRSPRVPLEKACDAIATYGRDNGWVRIYILGLFPLTALNKFLGPDDIVAAQKRSYHRTDIEWSQNRLGVDTARFGDDRTAMVRRQGLVMWPSEHMRGADSTDIAARVAVLHGMEGVGPFDMVLVDAGGPNAGGSIDQMRAAGVPVIEVSSSGKAPDPRFYNNRAYMDWQAAEWVKSRGQFPKDAAMAREAVMGFYDLKNGKLISEDKGEIKRRLGESPDLWDGGKLTFALPDAPKGVALPGDHPLAHSTRGPQVAITEYDAFK